MKQQEDLIRSTGYLKTVSGKEKQDKIIFLDRAERSKGCFKLSMSSFGANEIDYFPSPSKPPSRMSPATSAASLSANCRSTRPAWVLDTSLRAGRYL